MADHQQATRLTIIKSFVGIALLLYFAYSLFVQDSRELALQIQLEINLSSSLMPSDKWKMVTSNTESHFSHVMNDLNLRTYLNTVLIPENHSESGINLVMNKFSSFNYTASRNIPLIIFQTLYRWNLLFVWGVLFIPFIAAFAIDGMYQWKLKRFQFGKVTIQFYRIWLKAFTLITVLISAYLILPNIFIFNNVAQLFPPLACLILGVAFNRLAANFQKLM